MAKNEREWVVEPKTARVDIAIGPDAEISPALREALVQVAQALADDDVSGYLMNSCSEVMICNAVREGMCDINWRCNDVRVTSN